jgi:predicted nuclease of restriction endonuclease-like (RecB) superfamily
MHQNQDEITYSSQHLFSGIQQLIQQATFQTAVYVNATVNNLYRNIGNFITSEIKYQTYANYGKEILAKVAQQLTEKFGKGYSYSALTRMVNVAKVYDAEKFATLSQALSRSHLVELVAIPDATKRLFYQQMAVVEHWSVRTLRINQDKMLFERSTIASKPEEIIVQAIQEHQDMLTPDLVFRNSYILDFLGLHGNFSEKDLEEAIISQLEQFILELGQGFAFMERQKRLSIDSIDYYLDLLFYHRGLKRLVAIDLKLGKFKPEYEGQMLLYLRYLNQHEKKEGEDSPIGLILCSEGNTEHIEYLMLEESNVKVAQYFTQLPDKEVLSEKLNRAIAIAKERINSTS